jgi:hypothetical protein
MKLLFAAAHESGIGRETDIETPPVNVRYWTPSGPRPSLPTVDFKGLIV